MNHLEELIHYSQQLKLLYVGNNLQTRASTQTILGEFFSNIVMAKNGAEGLVQFSQHHQQASKKNFDLVISDVDLKIMNGLDMIEQIKAIDHNISILACSSYSQPDLFIRSIILEIDGYLLKPFNRKQFIRILEKVIHKLKLQVVAHKSQHLLEQYKDITDKSGIVSIIDVYGTLIYVNDAYCKISEQSMEDIIGSQYHLNSQSYQTEELYNEIWSTIKDKKEVWQGETQHTSKSGRIYYLQNTIKPIIDTNGEIIEYIALRNDITEICLAVQEKEQYLILEKDQADASNKSKTAFIATMSHELRTPMNAILGFSHILLEDDRLYEDQHDCVQEIHQAGQQLLNQINSLLEITQIESGNLEILVQPMPFIEAVIECFTLCSPLAQKEGIIMTYDKLDHYNIYANRDYFKKILSHLLDNAIKYNHKKGNIKLEASIADNNFLKMSVIDLGNGISNENKEKIFQPFVRFDARKYEIDGTGIGLRICKSIVEMMGGKIGFSSELTIGSCFWFELPIVKE